MDFGMAPTIPDRIILDGNGQIIFRKLVGVTQDSIFEFVMGMFGRLFRLGMDQMVCICFARCFPSIPIVGMGQNL
jgi:hypothetical protein